MYPATSIPTSLACLIALSKDTLIFLAIASASLLALFPSKALATSSGFLNFLSPLEKTASSTYVPTISALRASALGIQSSPSILLSCNFNLDSAESIGCTHFSGSNLSIRVFPGSISIRLVPYSFLRSINCCSY